MENFHSFLFGQEFDVYVDHQPLSWLQSCKKPNSRLARWLIRINNYTFKIHYKPGKTHTNADALSRWPLPIDDEKVIEDNLLHVANEKEPKLVINVINSVEREKLEQNNYNTVEINGEEQDKDNCIKWVKDLIVQHGEQRPDINKFETEFKKRLYESYENLVIDNNVLYFRKEISDGTILRLFVLPKHLVQKTIEKVHSTILSGHLGVRKTYDKLRLRFYTPKLKHKTITFIKECVVCQKVKHPKQLFRAQLQPIRSIRPFQLITIDIIGPLPASKDGQVYILVVCCHFSKWVALYAMKNTTTDTVARLLIKFMLTFGLCLNILSDLGTNFQAELLRKIYELLDINQLRTTAYHPECDGLTERFNRTLKTMIACFVNEHQNNWDELLTFLAFAYNSSTHATTNFTPYEIVYGRPPKIPIDLIVQENDSFGGEGDDIHSYSENQEVNFYVKELKEKFRSVYKCVQENTNSKVEKSKLYYDRNLKPMDYKKGDLVLLNIPKIKPGLSKKLAPKWEGPFEILERVGPVNYKIKKVNHAKAKVKLVHHNRLKKFFGKSNEPKNGFESESDEEPSKNETKQIPQKKKCKSKNKQHNGSGMQNVSDCMNNSSAEQENQKSTELLNCPNNSQLQFNTNKVQLEVVSEVDSSTDTNFIPTEHFAKQIPKEPVVVRKSARTKKPVDRFKF